MRELETREKRRLAYPVEVYRYLQAVCEGDGSPEMQGAIGKTVAVRDRCEEQGLWTEFARRVTVAWER